MGLVALLYPRYLWYVLVFTIPLSVDWGGGLQMSLPAEALAVLLAFALLLRGIIGFSPQNTQLVQNISIFRSPIFICILLDVGMMAISAMTSEMPMVSVKKWLIRVLFITIFYVYPTRLFHDKKEIYRFFYLYIAGMSLAIIYTSIRHAEFGFTPFSAADMPKPLFPDHTLYAAILAFLFPFVLFHFIRDLKQKKISIQTSLILLLFSFAIVTAASRAAWLGLLVASGMLILLKWKIPFHRMLFAFMMIVSVLYIYKEPIIAKIHQNKAQSHNPAAQLSEHFLSMTNIQTDVSNKERINRWVAAYDMFVERPLTGFGAGTYQFCYANYQRFYYLTQISTRNGDKGNAHSEYLTYLSEHGILGFISFLLLILVIFRENIHLIYFQNDNALLIAVLLGLVTYFVHGFFNFFLDQIEASSLVWASLAILEVNRKNRSVSLENH